MTEAYYDLMTAFRAYVVAHPGDKYSPIEPCSCKVCEVAHNFLGGVVHTINTGCCDICRNLDPERYDAGGGV